MPGYIKGTRREKRRVEEMNEKVVQNDVSLVEVNKKVINYSAPINSDSRK